MCILAARGFQGRKEYGRLLEKSSQLETKMIYFLQQISHLCHEFYGEQRELNKPIPEEERYIERTQGLVSPPRYEQYNQIEKPREKLPVTLYQESIVNSNTEMLNGGKEIKTLKTNPIARANQAKKTSSKTPSPKKTYTNPVSESGYKINPIVLETQRQMENEYKEERRGESFVIDTNPLGLNYRGVEKRNEPPLRATPYRSEAKEISSAGSSNVLVVRQPSNVGYTRRKPQETGRSKTPENVEVHEVQDVTDLRARLRRTGQIEEGSGLHRIELARQHSQRIIDVQ